MTLTTKQWKWCGQIRVLIPRAVLVAFGINAAKTAMHSKNTANMPLDDQCWATPSPDRYMQCVFNGYMPPEPEK